MKNRMIAYVLAFFTLGLCAKSNAEIGGDLLQGAFPIISIGLTALNDDSNGRSMFYKGSALTIASTYLLKISINKKRPNGGGWSFPSGHTSWAFSNAAFIHKRYGKKLGIPAFLLASFVGWSRVESKNHYWNDVVWGAVLGAACSYFSTSRFTLNSTSDATNNQIFLNLSIKL